MEQWRRQMKVWAEKEGIRIVTERVLKTFHRMGESSFIGAGSYGKCTQLTVKSLHLVLKQFGNKNAVHMMKQELRGLKKSQGPGVQKLFGFCPENGEIITKYAGKTLDKWVGKKVLTVKKSLYILYKVMNTVQRMIERKLCHNDIKLDNICVQKLDSEQPRVTLIDLGLATSLGEEVYEPVSRKKAKDMPWLAPEMTLGKQCTEASEVFSLGCLAKQLVSGKTKYPPCLSKWIETTQRHDAKQRPSLAKSILVVKKCLESLE
ncbi:probable serine/threonine-protein kinase DDB_G0281745 [Panulirus ornatus]|uniref:probable serine/threonine-protein kinase DDB_G0281745 n=1 Tax=Panulirus ornatus TaxID=150431 RepID=UPI003A88282B